MLGYWLKKKKNQHLLSTFHVQHMINYISNPDLCWIPELYGQLPTQQPYLTLIDILNLMSPQKEFLHPPQPTDLPISVNGNTVISVS